ncbi:hypothetical protein FXO37_28763 [Capsicum annuum]|nr:hypothetical protein FXO37_28763 [Capsicum annuum]
MVSLTNRVMTIWGKKVNFRAEPINEVYGLPNTDIKLFQEKGYELGTWMEHILYLGKEVHWAITKKDILLNDFTAEARLWMNIICSRVSACTYMTMITDMRARMVACILSSISLNMGEILILEWRYFKNRGGTLLYFPSFIAELCKKIETEEYVEDTRVHLGPRIFPLKFWGEGAPSQTKKRKVDSGKSTQKDTTSCRP